MEIVVDNQIIQILVHNVVEMMKTPLLADPHNHINFRWPSLLEYLDLGSLLKNLPAFDPSQPLFNACLTTLCVNEEKETLFYLYDSLFAECLNQIKDLPQINAPFLLRAIKICRLKPSFSEAEKMISSTLRVYETALSENVSRIMHDLILYLAWNRMCVCITRLFDYQSTDPKFIKGLVVLRECLIESYLHITQQGRTSPSLYRLIESLFFYQIREENLQKHTDAEWATLSQSFQILKAQDELADFFYIDDAVVSLDDHKREPDISELYLTLDAPDRVNSRLALAQYIMDKLKLEVPQWCYSLQPKKIVYLESR
jgi:hypothetical protein